MVGGPKGSLGRILAPWLWAKLLASLFPTQRRGSLNSLIHFLRKAFTFYCLCEQCLSFLVSFWRAETCEFLRRLKESLVPGTVSKLIQVKPHFLPEWNMSQTPSPLNNKQCLNKKNLIFTQVIRKRFERESYLGKQSCFAFRCVGRMYHESHNCKLVPLVLLICIPNEVHCICTPT